MTLYGSSPVVISQTLLVQNHNDWSAYCVAGYAAGIKAEELREKLWLAKPKLFIIQPFSEKAC